MRDATTIFAIAGSLRKDSYNRAALRAATELVPSGVKLDVFDHLASIPPFNQDQEWMPDPVVVHLKARIRSAAAVLFVTPEYNYGVPGVLKNAIDWASRPHGDSAWEGKPVAVMGASPSMLGTARAQYQLRQSFVYLNMRPLNRPEVMIANASQQFDDQGNLINETSRELIRELLAELAKAGRDYAVDTPEEKFPSFRPKEPRLAQSAHAK